MEKLLQDIIRCANEHLGRMMGGYGTPEIPVCEESIVSHGYRKDMELTEEDVISAIEWVDFKNPIKCTINVRRNLGCSLPAAKKIVQYLADL